MFRERNRKEEKRFKQLDDDRHSHTHSSSSSSSSSSTNKEKHRSKKKSSSSSSQKRLTINQKNAPVPSAQLPISKLNLQKRRAFWFAIIRHACDEPDHTDIRHKHDPGLCNNSQHNREDIIKVVKELRDRCGGEPDLIFVSPLERCYETVHRMLKVLKKKPEIRVEEKVSRYFTPSEQEAPDISKRSLHRGTPITESRREFDSRIEKHLHEVEKTPIRVIWTVTHAFVMKTADKLTEEEKPWTTIPPLAYRIYQREKQRNPKKKIVVEKVR